MPVRCLIFLFLLSGLFVLSAQIGAVQSPGTGLFCVYAVFSAFGFVGLFPEFVGFMGKFVGLLRGSLVFRAVRWNIG